MTGEGKGVKMVEPDLRNTYVATNRIDVPCTQAGWAEAKVRVLDEVHEGQDLATVYNSWGDVVERVKAPRCGGKVLQVRTDPAVEGGSVVIVLVNNATGT